MTCLVVTTATERRAVIGRFGGTENSHSVSGPQEQIMYGYKFCFVSQFACTQRTETLSDTSERQNQVAVSGLNDYH